MRQHTRAAYAACKCMHSVNPRPHVSPLQRTQSLTPHNITPLDALPRRRFRWLAFVQTLEKRTKSFAQLPRSSSALAKAPSTLAKLHSSASQLSVARAT